MSTLAAPVISEMLWYSIVSLPEAAYEGIDPLVAGKLVVARAAVDSVVVVPGGDGVVARAAVIQVIASLGSPPHVVVSAERPEGVVAGGALQRVGAGGAVDEAGARQLTAVAVVVGGGGAGCRGRRGVVVIVLGRDIVTGVGFFIQVKGFKQLAVRAEVREGFEKQVVPEQALGEVKGRQFIVPQFPQLLEFAFFSGIDFTFIRRALLQRVSFRLVFVGLVLVRRIAGVGFPKGGEGGGVLEIRYFGRSHGAYRAHGRAERKVHHTQGEGDHLGVAEQVSQQQGLAARQFLGPVLLRAGFVVYGGGDLMHRGGAPDADDRQGRLHAHGVGIGLGYLARDHAEGPLGHLEEASWRRAVAIRIIDVFVHGEAAVFPLGEHCAVLETDLHAAVRRSDQDISGKNGIVLGQGPGHAVLFGEHLPLDPGYFTRKCVSGFIFRHGGAPRRSGKRMATE